MYAAMRRYCYWPGMAEDVVLHVRNCASCARGRVRPLRAAAALQLFPATLPFQDIATDLFGPLAKTAAGNEYIMVMTDRFFKLVRAIPMRKIRAVDCGSVLLDNWIGAYGPPDRVLSDGGPQFTAQFWHQVCNLLSVEAKVTTPSRPQTHGQAERFNPRWAVFSTTTSPSTPLRGTSFSRRSRWRTTRSRMRRPGSLRSSSSTR